MPLPFVLVRCCSGKGLSSARCLRNHFRVRNCVGLVCRTQLIIISASCLPVSRKRPDSTSAISSSTALVASGPSSSAVTSSSRFIDLAPFYCERASFGVALGHDPGFYGFFPQETQRKTSNAVSARRLISRIARSISNSIKQSSRIEYRPDLAKPSFRQALGFQILRARRPFSTVYAQRLTD